MSIISSSPLKVTISLPGTSITSIPRERSAAPRQPLRIPASAAFNLHRGCWHEVPTAVFPETVVLLTSHAAVTKGWAELDKPGQITAGDVEKREISAHLGVDLRWQIPGEIYATLGLAR